MGTNKDIFDTELYGIDQALSLEIQGAILELEQIPSLLKSPQRYQRRTDLA